MTETEQTEAIDTEQPARRPGNFRNVIDVLRDAGEPLRLIEIAKRCNNGCHILDAGRRTSTQVLRELETLETKHLVARTAHRFGGYEYAARIPRTRS